jgi:NAD(P)-dependent dehydrogenase (short-subunit alcohol dehydrogenase family)
MNYQSAGAVDDHQHFPGLDRVRVSAGTAADIGRTKGCLWDYRLHLVVADFTRLAQVADRADMLTVAMPALDVLVNNAAVGASERYTSPRTAMRWPSRSTISRPTCSQQN